MDMLANPWRNLPTSAPYVLPEDELAVAVFNSDKKLSPKHRLHTETPPEPFLGHFDAPIVVLLLNPGVNKQARYDVGLADSMRSAGERTNHFYMSKHNAWWDKLVRSIAQDRPTSKLDSAILSVEFFPYRSEKFGCGHVRVPSQEFSFNLVRRAIKRKAAIIVVRGWSHWTGAVPELVAEGDPIGLANPQSASLSAKNLGDGAYAKVLGSLDGIG